MIRKEEIADGTLAVYLERPVGFEYRAGQYAFFTIPEDVAGKRIERHFTFASAPHEKDLMFATRIRAESEYKQTLLRCPEGTGLELDGSYGEFVLGEGTGPVIGLAHGIGIAPFFSIVKDMKEKKASLPMIIFYAETDPDRAVFLEELYALADEVSGLRVIATMTGAGEFLWEGERGPVTEDMIKKYVPEPHEALFYISGQFDMIKMTKDIIRGMGILDSRMHIETFSGY